MNEQWFEIYSEENVDTKCRIVEARLSKKKLTHKCIHVIEVSDESEENFSYNSDTNVYEIYYYPDVSDSSYYSRESDMFTIEYADDDIQLTCIL